MAVEAARTLVMKTDPHASAATAAAGAEDGAGSRATGGAVTEIMASLTSVVFVWIHERPTCRHAVSAVSHVHARLASRRTLNRIQ